MGREWVLIRFGIGTGTGLNPAGAGGVGIDFENLPRDRAGSGLILWDREGTGVKIHSRVMLYSVSGCSSESSPSDVITFL